MTSTEGARFAFKFPPNGPNLTHLFVDRVLSQENALLMPSCGVLLGLILGHGDLFENTAGVGPTKGGGVGQGNPTQENRYDPRCVSTEWRQGRRGEG